jgi:uncharacterized protein YbjQ (UPF0145 family)
MRTVFIVRVITKDMISDFFARVRSIIGGRVKSYERLIEQTLNEMSKELYKKYPKVKNVRLGTTEMIADGAELILYGEIK